MAATTISLGQTVSGPVVPGTPVDYELDLAVGGKIVVTFDGEMLGCYGPFAAGVALKAGTGNGYLRICGNAVGTRIAPAGRNLLQVTSKAGTPYTLSVRSWQFTDYIASLFWKKSTC